MLDKRHAEDTLFLIAEADHRFFKEDDVDTEAWLTVVGESTFFSKQDVWAAVDAESQGKQAKGSSWQKPSPTPSAASSSQQPRYHASATWDSWGDTWGGTTRSSWKRGWGTDADGADLAVPPDTADIMDGWTLRVGEQSAGTKRAVGNWTAGAKPLKRASTNKPTKELEAVVQIANVAMRRQVGNLVWYTWCGSKSGRSFHPCHGSMLLGLTQDGAQDVLHFLKTSKATHLDLVVLHACMEGTVRGCSYVWPSVGSYATHPSPNCGNAEREGEWEKSWTQEGVEPTKPDHRQRFLMGFQPKGLHQIAKIDFSLSYTVCGRTESPPDDYRDFELDMKNILRRRHWVQGPRDEWVGPAKGLGKGQENAKGTQKGDGGGQSGKTHGAANPWGAYDSFRKNPNRKMDMSGQVIPVTLSALEVVCDPLTWNYNSQANTETLWESRRTAQRLYKWRRFAAQAEQAI